MTAGQHSSSHPFGDVCSRRPAKQQTSQYTVKDKSAACANVSKPLYKWTDLSPSRLLEAQFTVLLSPFARYCSKLTSQKQLNAVYRYQFYLET